MNSCGPLKLFSRFLGGPLLLRTDAVISLSESSLEQLPVLSEFESSCELEGLSIVGCDEVLDDVSVTEAGLTFRFAA